MFVVRFPGLVWSILLVVVSYWFGGFLGELLVWFGLVWSILLFGSIFCFLGVLWVSEGSVFVS